MKTWLFAQPPRPSPPPKTARRPPTGKPRAHSLRTAGRLPPRHEHEPQGGGDLRRARERQAPLARHEPIQLGRGDAGRLAQRVVSEAATANRVASASRSAGKGQAATGTCSPGISGFS
jgi:hypothetical protein